MACLASGSGACGRGRTLCGRLSAGLITVYGAEHASIIFNLCIRACVIAAGDDKVVQVFSLFFLLIYDIGKLLYTEQAIIEFVVLYGPHTEISLID